jgi:hypothetical protein
MLLPVERFMAAKDGWVGVMELSREQGRQELQVLNCCIRSCCICSCYLNLLLLAGVQPGF